MSDFKRQIVAFNEREYNRAMVDVNNKIKRLKDALKWCSSFLDWLQKDNLKGVEIAMAGGKGYSNRAVVYFRLYEQSRQS